MIPEELAFLIIFAYFFFCHWKKQAPCPPIFKLFPKKLIFLIFLSLEKSGTMDPKILVKSSEI